MATIQEIKSQLSQITDLTDQLFDQLTEDHRSGVQKAIQKRKKELLAEVAEQKRLEGMLAYEKALYEQGIGLIAGIDEVGRGPLAGPVVAAAVILPKKPLISGLNDSKKIPKSKHQAIYQAVLKEALAVGIGVQTNQDIDELNIYQATKKAMLAAIDQLPQKPQHLLIDAMSLETDISQTAIIKGDANSLSIAAASIVAKVTRDQLMADYDQIYPGYGFAKNAGYGTKEHLEALKTIGISPIHRQTFEPVKSLLAEK